MTTHLMSKSLAEYNSGSDCCEASAIATSDPHAGKSAESNRAKGKRRESFLSALLRVFSSVNF